MQRGDESKQRVNLSNQVLNTIRWLSAEDVNPVSTRTRRGGGGAFHKTCHQWQMTICVISYWNPCFWLVISRFVTDFCNFVIEKRLCETPPRWVLYYPITYRSHMASISKAMGISNNSSQWVSSLTPCLKRIHWELTVSKTHKQACTAIKLSVPSKCSKVKFWVPIL